MTTTLRFPARMIEVLALGAHERAYAERGERYATPEEMAMHRGDPLACDDMVMPAIRDALAISDQFDRGYRVRRDGQDVIEFTNLWDEDDTSAPQFKDTEFRSFEAPAKVELIYVGGREAMVFEVAAFDPTSIGVPAAQCRYLVMSYSNAQWDTEWFATRAEARVHAEHLVREMGGRQAWVA